MHHTDSKSLLINQNLRPKINKKQDAENTTKLYVHYLTYRNALVIGIFSH